METHDEASRNSKEEVAIVLDYLPNGYPFEQKPGQRAQPMVQALGKEHLSILELVPKRDMFFQPQEEIYIGEGKRDKVHHVVGKISMDRLTPTATTALEEVLHTIVKKNEQRFLKFFNIAQPLTTRMHSLELLPGFGKKHMWQLIEARDKEQFKSFADLRKRVHLMPDPEKAVVKRILLELEGNEKHKLFVMG